MLTRPAGETAGRPFICSLFPRYAGNARRRTRGTLRGLSGGTRDDHQSGRAGRPLGPKPAYPVLNTGTGEGMLRPPSNPRPLAPLPEQRTTGGAAPGPPHRCAHGAAAHRCGLRRPRPSGAGRLRPDGGGPPAPKRRGAGPQGRQRRPRAVARPPRVRIEDRAAYGGPAGRRLDPPQAGPEAFPQGSVAP